MLCSNEYLPRISPARGHAPQLLCQYIRYVQSVQYCTFVDLGTDTASLVLTMIFEISGKSEKKKKFKKSARAMLKLEI